MTDDGPTAMIDLARYPIEDLSTPAARSVVAEGQRQLARDGLCLLPGFLRAESVAAMAAESEALLPNVYRRDLLLDAYGQNPPADLPPDHPRRRRHRFRMGLIAQDRLPPDSRLLRIYNQGPLADFIAAVIGRPLHRCDDPLLSCAVSVLSDGDEHGWHFDSNDFVVTLLLQAATRGGHFEYAPMIRDDEDENYDAVRHIFDGDRRAVVRAAVEPGTLVLFQGQRSLHRVSRAEGPRSRLNAIFSYHTEPGKLFSAETRIGALGRAA